MKKMTREQIEAKVYGVIIDVLDPMPEQVCLATSLHDDLQTDSIDCVELLIHVEREFSLNIPDEDAEKVKTIGDVCNLVEKLVRKQEQKYNNFFK